MRVSTARRMVEEAWEEWGVRPANVLFTECPDGMVRVALSYGMSTQTPINTKIPDRMIHGDGYEFREAMKRWAFEENARMPQVDLLD